MRLDGGIALFFGRDVMRILGIDPGSATTGYGIVEAREGELTVVTYGVIRTSADFQTAQRLETLYHAMRKLLAEFAPDTAGVEELFFGRNITTAIKVGQARGVILLALAQAGLEPGEYSPPKIKETVAGYGNADKAQMQLMVRHLLNLAETPRPDDAADGLAVAITHYRHHHFRQLAG
jgi:crossover junction endodeoxyribonuclease RuvC